MTNCTYHLVRQLPLFVFLRQTRGVQWGARGPGLIAQCRGHSDPEGRAHVNSVRWSV